MKPPPKALNRRDFLLVSGAAVLGAGEGLAAGKKQASAGTLRPNILVIMTDQQFAGAMSCAGNADL